MTDKDSGNVIDDDEIDAQYRQMVDSFIDRANELVEENSMENVGMALLFAASRFNAYVVSQHAETGEAFQADLPKAREFFKNQYREMLDENLEDYQQIYNKYSKFVKKH
jgi:hypothetical protein